MSGTLHCPFCGAELETHYYEYENSRGDTCYGDSGMLVCASCGDGCSSHRKPMLPEIWQALIDGKKAQDALNRAISEITDLCTTILYCSGEADNEIQMIQMRDEMVKEAKARIFGEITSITK